LRERRQDILPLARRFLSEMATAMGRTGMSLDATAELALAGYDWPGNVREMENVVQRAVILAPSERVKPEHLHLPARSFAASCVAAAPAESEGSAQDLKSLEKTHIMATLSAVNGSRKLAAQKLGMSERTLRHKLQQYRESD
jgi:two-component system response regulator FlrC